MDDTSPEVARMVREHYAAMGGAERLMIGARMFDTARSIILASLPADLTPLERRRALCRRLYPKSGDEIISAITWPDDNAGSFQSSSTGREDTVGRTAADGAVS